MVHGLSDGHHHSPTVSPELIRISDYLSFISFGISLIFIFGFTRYKQKYRLRYSRDIFQASIYQWNDLQLIHRGKRQQSRGGRGCDPHSHRSHHPRIYYHHKLFQH